VNKTLKLLLVAIAILISGLLGFIVSFYSHRNSDIPLQQSSVQTIQTFHYPALFVKQLAGDPQAGKKIFKEFCSACHSKEPLIDIHAPAIGDQSAWRARKQLGIPLLLKITITGVGAMPARGGCFECSDDQLRQTIQYILNQ
jgi:cytochrome c5